jgi:pimeloyl-ACP methyl ester carboxylesterase
VQLPCHRVQLLRMAEDRLDQLDFTAMVVPTLVLMAQDDDLCPPAAMKGLVARLPLARLHVVPGSHSAYYEKPEGWNGALLEFLGTCPS